MSPSFEQPEDIGAAARKILADVEANTHDGLNGLGQKSRFVEIGPFAHRVTELRKKLVAAGHEKWTAVGLSEDEARFLDDIWIGHNMP